MRRLDDERVIGQHEGLTYYTLGQREGLGIGGVKGAPEEPWFVAAKDMEKNVLYVVQGHDHPALLRSQLTAGQLSWISGDAAAHALGVCRQDALPHAGCGLRYRDLDGRSLRDRFRRAAVGGDAGSVRGDLREPGVPRRRRDFVNLLI